MLRATTGLASIGVTLLGVVANRISRDHKTEYYGYGGYGYGYGDASQCGEEEESKHDESELSAAVFR